MRAPDPATKTNGIVAVRLKVLLVKRNIVARHRQQNVADRVTQVS
jgi:phage terminase large subunit-like protein